jgi:hypothetical protein
MSYIIKTTSGLINTRLTDVGRRKLSQGNFNITYFQIGDSEVSYTAVPSFNIVNNNILMPSFNAQNDTGTPQSNKENIKYPYFLNGGDGNTYGIPYMNSQVEPVYNSAGSKGFFSATTATTSVNNWDIQSASAYTVTSNYTLDMSLCTGTNTIQISPAVCSPTTGTPLVGDFVVVNFQANAANCGEILTVPVLTYKIQNVVQNGVYYTLTLDRNLPDYSNLTLPAGVNNARVYVYPSGMTQLYDTITPLPFWQIDTLNFESPCDVRNRENTLIWNMNIPWTESPAGLFSNTYENFTKYGSEGYVGTKELLGYNESTGQTDTSEVFYYNSYDEKITVKPEDQKAIAIIHYTNQDIDNVYGEKFATVPFDPNNPQSITTGLATNFKLSLPTLMWHKTTGSTIGSDFYIDPPSVNNLCIPYYIKSKVNSDMNDPGIRYFHLYDDNIDSNGSLNRVGKVFPDQQMVVIDDEEIVAAMSYKSNRNWTLPAPQLTLVTPNVCNPNPTPQSNVGIMANSKERMWITYIFKSQFFTNSLHCNYYSVINGPDTGCTISTQNVLVRFGNEFPFLSSNVFPLDGFSAEDFSIICQKRTDDLRPDPTQWKEINFYNILSATTVNGYLCPSGMTNTNFEITQALYNAAPTYDLSTYLNGLPTNGQNNIMNFGDEYFFYGNLETDITATIYEMKYNIILNNNQYTNTSNPTWTSGTTSYITEIGLYNAEKELMIISKLQSPEIRQNIQQFVVKLDF